MAHDHGHGGHGHDHSAGLGDTALLWAVVINLGLTAVQIIGGTLADSVALVADGVHNLSDALALVLAFGARKLATRSASPSMSFGWGRAEIVAAFVNYLALIAVSIWLLVEAFGRLSNPPPVAGGVVMALAGLALVIDLGTAWLTARLAKESVNIRAAYLHNLADAGVSVAVLIGGGLILAFGWRIADPILTILISLVILWHIRGDIVGVTRMLMLGAPSGIDSEALCGDVLAVPEVEGMHHLHLWQIDERRISAEMHVVVAVSADDFQVRVAVRRVLDGYGISHATIETETSVTGCAELFLAAGHEHHDDHDHDHGHGHDHSHDHGDAPGHGQSATSHRH